MKITHQEFLYTLKKGRTQKKFEAWLLESFAFDDTGATYIKPEYRKDPNGWRMVNFMKKRKCEIGDCNNNATVLVMHHNSDLYKGLVMHTCEACRLKHYVDYNYRILSESEHDG